MTAVSILVPAFNSERTLGETLNSIQQQLSPVQEVIVIDDGSTDGTAGVAARFPHVQLIRQQNAGVATALNTGAAAARGDMLICLDADDLLPDGAVSSHLAFLAARPDLDAAVGFMEEFVCPSEGAEGARRLQPRPRRAGWLSGATALRAGAFRRAGPFDTELRAGYWIDWMDRARQAGLTFGVHDAIVLRRRLHTGSLSMRSGIKGGQGLLDAARKAILRRRTAASSTSLEDKTGNDG